MLQGRLGKRIELFQAHDGRILALEIGPALGQLVEDLAAAQKDPADRLGRLRVCQHRSESAGGKILEAGDRRRKAQLAWNEEHGITPESVKSRIHEHLSSIYERDYVDVAVDAAAKREDAVPVDIEDIPKRIDGLREAMFAAAKDLDFEEAARLRDELFQLEKHELEVRG